MQQPSPRLTRTFVQHIHAAPEAVFPLLCPEMEKHWLPGWDYRMIHSQSGVAEPAAVFETAHELGRTLWVVTAHEAPRRVAFARWQPDDLLVVIEITLVPVGAEATEVHVRYCWTATGERAAPALGKLTEAAWRDNMEFWERSMNAWLAENAQSPAPAQAR